MESLESIANQVKKAEEEPRQENGEINIEIEKLKKLKKEIKELKKDYKVIFLVEPSGENGRSYKEEYEIFYEKIKENLNEEKDLSDEEYSEISPVFEYSRIEEMNIEDLEKVVIELEKIRKRAGKEFNDSDIAELAFESLDIAEAEMNFLKNKYYGNSEKAFECSKIIYGDFDEELPKKCEDMYEEGIEFLKTNRDKGEVEENLENLEFDAESIKAFFNMAIIKAGLKDSEFEAVVTDKVNNIRVSSNYSGFDHPVVMIPPDRKVDGMKLIRLIAHEIGRHVATSFYNKKQGFGDGLAGKDWDLFSEGIALVSENEAKKAVLGDAYQKGEDNLGNRIYYILAMEKVRGEKNKDGEYENGWNYAKVYKYIYKKRYEEELCRQGYYDIKNKYDLSDEQGKKELKAKIESMEKKSKKIAVDIAEKICLRIFKGFDPKCGELFSLKDKTYAEGKIESEKLSEIDSSEKLEKYLRLSEVNPKLIPILIKAGAYSYEKGIEAATKVGEKIWEEEGWPRELLQGEKKHELFISYLNEFMEKYYKDDLYSLYDLENKNEEQN